MLYCRWQIFRFAGRDGGCRGSVNTGLQGDVSVPVGDAGALCLRFFGDDGSTCRFFFPFIIDIGRLYGGSSYFTFVEDGRFRYGDSVECAVVEDAAVAERGEWSVLIMFEVAVDEDAAVAELNEVGECGVLENGAVVEVSTWAEATTFFHLSVFSYIPLSELVEHLIFSL